jgi:tetratricopeptide (TPR) repeat protein
MPRRVRCNSDWLPVIAIVAVTFVAFIPALDAGFVSWDDNRNFGGNPDYRGLGAEQLRWMWTTTLMGHYIPLTWMTLGLDFTLWGMDGRGYHLTNLALHCAAAVLLYRVALRLFRAGAPEIDVAELRVPVAAAALLFAVHPLRVESVAWITERRDMLSLALYLASLDLYLRFVGGRRRALYAWSLAAFACALLSKATAVTLPAVLLLANAIPLGRLRRGELASPGARAVYSEIVPFAVLSAAVGLASIAVLHPPAQLGPGGKLAVTLYSLGFYLLKTAVPAGLAPLYELPKSYAPGDAKYFACYAIGIAALGAAWWLRKRWPAALAVVIASGLIILPLLGIVQNGPQIAADRYTYHAAAAFSLLAGLALVKWPSRALGVAMAAAIVALAVLTWRQSGYWKDSDRLWSRVLAVDSASSIAQIAIADLRLEQGRFDEALHHYELGVALDPGYAEGHNNLGSLLARNGRFAEAIGHYEKAVALRPKYPGAQHNWGIALSSLGEPDSAIAHFRRALALQPDLVNVHQSWGNALLRAARLPEAIGEYAEEERLHPGNAQAHLNWGVALAQQKDYQPAMEHFVEALRLDPSLDVARDYLSQAHRLVASAGRRR